MTVDLKSMAHEARQAALILRTLPREVKDRALNLLAEKLITEQDAIIAANARDLLQAEAAGLAPAMIDRLRLDSGRLAGIAADLRKVIELDDPVGEVFDKQVMPNGLQVHKVRVPIGVLAVIYESRPNVTIDVTGLALKSGNAVILRGGSETLHSNRVLVAVIRAALAESGLPQGAVQFIDSPDRSLVMELLQMGDEIDMLIPRGGAGLHRFCRENSRIPVITGGIGVCHLFVDESADLPAAMAVIRNAKVQRPSVCNALDTMLVHRVVAAEFIRAIVRILSTDGVTFRLDSEALAEISQYPDLQPFVAPAGPDDFDTEWLSLVLGIKVVAGLEEALDHIQAHSTGHSDGILTQDAANADRFVQMVDSAAVYVNASTRFTDGSQLGLGAEVAISTQRLHARGPMALEALTTYKWVIRGENHVRPD
ncbi:MAG: glutamate-5-semialdehyde dehydrogenase [Anaerolineaceae bacterium]|nr:glutamate-5-semialdehyde dehydrogenase [Anaerolineaceae bacterium]